MAWGDHGLPKVLPRPAMPYLSTPYRWPTPEMALQPFQGWPTTVLYPFGHPMPYAYEEEITSRLCPLGQSQNEWGPDITDN
jgi:hypothetical protein